MTFPNFLKQSPIPSVVNNQIFKASSTYDVINLADPRGKEILHSVSSVTEADVEKICQSASSAFPAWRATSFQKRREIFQNAQDLIKSRMEEWVAFTMEETSMTKGMATLDLILALDQIYEATHVLAQALRVDMAPIEDDSTERQMILREPYGVVFGIAPWNFPFNLGMRSILTPILAGNTAILKTSEHSPRVHLCIAQILMEAGLPEGVLSVIHVAPKSDAPKVVEAITSHPSVRKLNFTGSTAVGRIIAQVAAKYLKPCVLELGGKAPMIVLKNADLSLASNQIVFSSLANQGQICMAGATILVHRSISKELQEKISTILTDHSEKFKAKRESNSKSQDSHHIRSLFNINSGERAKKIYEDAVKKGAKVFAGSPAFDGALVQPAFLSGVTREMEIFTQEVFGPIVGLVEFETNEEAIDLANFNETGLSASIYSRDETEAFKMARRIESGAVHINGSTVHDNPFVPHGGQKASGWGSFNGIWGLYEFTNLKVVTISDGHQVPYGIM